ncbi:MAG: O-antigen ligase family protein [Bacteroidales bacterium]|nr:O-antigen ligase family protein [Bacteroidales bacterium]
MNGIINLIVFLVLNAYFFIYMFRYSARIKDPLNSSRYMLIEGTEMFFVLLFATGTLALSSAGGGHGTGGGFNLQAIRLLMLEVALIMSLFVCVERPKWGIGTVMYLVYMLWLVLSLTWCSSIEFGIRYILKYLYPFIIMLTASAIVRDEKVFLALCVWARRVAAVAIIAMAIPFIGQLVGGLFWYVTALNLNLATISVVSFGLYYYYGKDKKDLIIGILCVLPTLWAVHRSGLLAFGGAVSVFMFMKHKWISLPYIAVVTAIGLAIVFYIPAFHKKMFWKDTDNELTVSDIREGNITQDDIRNNGREATWNMLERQFYVGHEMRGSGIGSCQKFLYDNPAGVKQTHGDFVQMRCDTGLIGFWLYIIVGAVVVVHCFFVTTLSYVPDHVKCCAMIAAGSTAGCYLAMYSENVVTYTMCSTGYSFALYGVMLGMLSKVKSPSYQYKERGLNF